MKNRKKAGAALLPFAFCLFTFSFSRLAESQRVDTIPHIRNGFAGYNNRSFQRRRQANGFYGAAFSQS
jgi:hypothetical protein